MTLNRSAWPALVLFTLVGPGCQDSAHETETNAGTSAVTRISYTLPETTDSGLPNEVDAQVAPIPIGEVAPKSREVVEAEVKAATEGEVKLETVTFDEYLARISKNKAKFTLVDAWATWCPPCKANFPHLVDMNTKYASKGLATVSLSFDDPTNTKQVNEAKQFLKDKKAVFANYLLDEGEGVGFDKFEINTIPAVFLYGPEGKLLRKFTLDDPNHQFTYEDVEKAVIAVLDGKPLPES
ncbi:TlpA disulfide reductase family protein [Singulisphaera rosea]